MARSEKEIEIQKQIGKHIREIREAKDWSQYVLAEKVSRSQRAISQIEAGLQSLSSADIVQFCDVLGVPVEVLFSGLTEQNIAPMDALKSLLVLDFDRLPDEKAKRMVLQVVSSLSAAFLSAEERH